MLLRKMHTEFVSKKENEVEPLVGKTFHFSKKKWAWGEGEQNTSLYLTSTRI
jgi:hypothetical protein